MLKNPQEKIKDLCLDFFSLSNCPVHKSDEDLWEVALTSETYTALNDGTQAGSFFDLELKLAFSKDLADLHREYLYVTVSSPLISAIKRVMSSLGVLGRCFLSFSVTDAEKIPAEFVFINCDPYLEKSSLTYKGIGQFNLKADIFSDEKTEELFPVYLDLETLQVANDLLFKIRGTEKLAGPLPDVELKTDFDLEKALQKALEVGQNRIKGLLDYRLYELANRLSIELKKAEDYFTQLESDLSAGNKQEELKDLQSFKPQRIAEIKSQHTLKAEISLLNVIVYFYPSAEYKLLALKAGRCEKLELKRDFLREALVYPQCPQCRKEITKVYLCSDHGLHCSDEFSECGICQKDVCRLCPTFRCSSCQIILCSDCGHTCSACQKSVCVSHLRVCGFCGREFCFNCTSFCPIDGRILCQNCAEVCHSCGRRLCSEHLTRHCHLCGSKVCGNCQTSICPLCSKETCSKHTFFCKACRKTVCNSHLEVCLSCGESLCAEHFAKECHLCGIKICGNCEKVCSICGETVCQRHAFTCSECGKVFCKTHQLTCGISKKEVCPDCVAACGCGQKAAKSKVTTCHCCNKIICFKCLNQQHCRACDKPLCSDCAVMCLSCGRNSCSEHYQTCLHCQRRVCVKCLGGKDTCQVCRSLASATKQDVQTLIAKTKDAMNQKKEDLNKLYDWKAAKGKGFIVFTARTFLNTFVIVTDSMYNLLLFSKKAVWQK